MQIGEQIKKFRKLHSVSLTTLAKDSGVQIATLSRIENGKMTGTLESHMSIASALGIELIDLYRELKDPLASPKDEDTLEVITSSDGKISQEILSHHLSSRKMLPVIIRIAPKASAQTDTYSNGSERFLYVLEGILQVSMNNRNVSLTPEMSLLFNANRPHTLSNVTDKPCKLLSITTLGL